MTRKITTVTELEALPAQTVFRTRHDELAELRMADGKPLIWVDGWSALSDAIEFLAPLTVLHVPGEASRPTPQPATLDRDETAQVISDHSWAGLSGRSHDDPDGIRWTCSCGHMESIDGMSGITSWLAAHSVHVADIILDLPGVRDTAAQVPVPLDRDDVVRAIHDNVRPAFHVDGWQVNGGFAAADAILALPSVQDVQEAKADAWDAGHEACWTYHTSEGAAGRQDNPYRADPREGEGVL